MTDTVADAGWELFVACLPGLEPWVAAESAALGAGVEPAPAVGSGGVACRGDRATVMRLALGLGCASHLLIRVAQFHARHFAELDKRSGKVDWPAWLRPGARFSVRVSSRKSKLYHTGGIAERVGAAVASRCGAVLADDATPADDVVPVHVRLVDDVCALSIDAAGRPLHECGWRLETAKAPLREDLAQALLAASGWDPATPLVDPFCGAGTIPIAAARRARRLPPSLPRHYAFEQLTGFEAAALAALRADVDARALAAAPAPIVGSDRDAGAVAIARRNAARAGVEADVTLAVAPLSGSPGFALDHGGGAVVTNPPFGRRVGGDDHRLVPVYQALGARIRELGDGYRCAILAADRRLALRTGLALRSAFLASHGGLRVRAMVG